MGSFFDKEGEPLSVEEWSQLFGDMEYRRIDHTDLPGGGYVSTVWLGIDHSFMAPSPHIFESMAFLDGKTGGDCRRYSTQEEARRGHVEMVSRLTRDRDLKPGPGRDGHG